MLPEIVDAVGSKMEILFDGGIRSGQDVMRALALGAKSCMIGRAYAYGLGAAGEAGVAKAIETIRNELNTTMGLCGVNTIAEIDDRVLAIRNGGTLFCHRGAWRSNARFAMSPQNGLALDRCQTPGEERGNADGAQNKLEATEGRSHRRRDAVEADTDAAGFQRAVVLFGGAEDDDLGARLHVPTSRRLTKVTIGVPGGTTTFFSPSLYLTRMFWPSVPAAVSATVALVMVLLGRRSQGRKSFGGSALGFRENVNRERPLGAVGFGHGGHADIGSRLDLGQLGLRNADHREIVGSDAP